MAATFTFINEDVWGKTHILFYNVTGDTSYPAGGYGSTTGLPPQLTNAVGLIQTAALGTVATSILYVANWDFTNKKLRLVTAGAEATGNITAVTLRIGFLIL